MQIIKRGLYNKFVIKPEEIPESYWETQRRIARELGHGNIDITSKMRDQLTEVITADQRSSLDKWVDYLSSSDAPYSDGLKYFTLRSVLNMSEFDKEKKLYPQRSKGTTKPFPDLNREALAYVLDAVEKKYQLTEQERTTLEQERKQEGRELTDFEKFLEAENFPRLYAWAIEKVTPASQEELVATKGEWVRYKKGTKYMPLVRSLQGHGTGWCTAGELTARAQLKGGDFYVYYSEKDGKYTVPRAAIRIENGKIAEVRGVAADQNLDPYVTPIVEEKLREFPDGKEYQKKVSDMKHLTDIERKSKEGVLLNVSDLSFLYEIDNPIQGFGYEQDPRIEEIRSQRSINEDMLVLFDCAPTQIAHTLEEIQSDTKVYVGPLVPGIFKRLKEDKIEHIFTSFPEGKIKMQEIEIGGKTKEEILQDLEQAGVKVAEHPNFILTSPAFTTLPTAQLLDIVRLQIKDLGLLGYNTTDDQVHKRIQELGLAFCPAEVGPRLLLSYADKPVEEDLYMNLSIGMDAIADPDIPPAKFILIHDENGFRLTTPGGWRPEDEYVFVIPRKILLGIN